MTRDQRLCARNLAIKAVFRDLVEMVGGVTRAAEKTRVNASRISNYCSPNDPSMPAADVILDLEFDVGEPIVTRAMADAAGFALVPKSKAEGQDADFVQHLGDVASQTADVVHALALALPNGVDGREAHQVCHQIGEAEEALARLKHDLAPLVASSPIPFRRTA